MDYLIPGMCLLLGVVSNVSSQDCTQCECNIVGDETQTNGVRTIQTRCQTGRISWKNLYGALRVQLQPSFSGHFQLCFIVESYLVNVHVAREWDYVPNLHKDHKHVINDAALESLFTINGRTKEYCISAQQPVILYLEPIRTSGGTGLGTFKLQYDIEKDAVQFNPSEECRPCSEEELIRSYCSSEFVVVGGISEVQHIDDATAEIKLDILQTIRQKGSHFRRAFRNSKTLQGTIRAPRKCTVTQRQETFLFTGREKLGYLHLSCASYLKDWLRLAKTAEEEGRMECSWG